MALRHGTKKRRSPSRTRRPESAVDFDLPPQERRRIPFSPPWKIAPEDEFWVTVDAMPVELFEAFYAVLWKVLFKEDPTKARRLYAALMEVMRSARSADEIVARLATF